MLFNTAKANHENLYQCNSFTLTAMQRVMLLQHTNLLILYVRCHIQQLQIHQNSCTNSTESNFIQAYNNLHTKYMLICFYYAKNIYCSLFFFEKIKVGL
jgi:hypothetical protein